MGSSPPIMAAVIDELTKGRQSLATLATLLLVDLPESPIAKLLLEEIMSSISKAIAVLHSRKSQDSMESQMDPLSSDVTSKAPGDKRKIQGSRKSANRNRGTSYCKRVTSDTIEDGNTWRKYGQKVIFSAKHPRSYFRCTYKNDRGCKATRQVQESEDAPFLYVITYFGEHTCDGEKQNSSRCAAEPACVISFESNRVNGISQEIPLSSFPPHNQENDEEVVSNLTSIDSPSNCLPGLNSPGASYDLDFMDLEEILSFDQNELFKW